MDMSIPPFYCCYLLRSTTAKVRGKAALYIGSTPNPRRRLRQHNGLSKGGANRTSNDHHRPWEMTALVTGFPSKIAALQFEWAWQNAHLTRHISKTQRITNAVPSRGRNGTGKLKWKRPQYSMKERLLNLQLLLRVKTFARWPLQVRFFAQDVFQTWQSKYIWPHRQLPPDFSADMHPGLSSDTSAPLAIPQGAEESSRIEAFEARPETQALYAIDVDGAGLKPQLQRSTFLLDGTRTVSCAVCSKGMDVSTTMILVCPNQDCNATSHLSCLAQGFLQSDEEVGTLVPRNGSCPSCSSSLRWIELVRDLSMRTRGQAELEKLFREKSKRKPKDAMAEGQTPATAPTEAAFAPATKVDPDDGDATDDDMEYDASFSEAQPAPSALQSRSSQGRDSGSEQDLPLPKTKRKNTVKSPKKSPKSTKKSKLAVVADSEWDDIDELT